MHFIYFKYISKEKVIYFTFFYHDEGNVIERRNDVPKTEI